MKVVQVAKKRTVRSGLNLSDFSANLNRRRDIIIRAMMDGCIECTRAKALCMEHEQEVHDLITSPREKLTELEKRIFGK